jgi:hypothetical protein
MSFNSIPAALIAHYRAGAFFTDALTAYPNAAFTKPGPSVAWASLFNLPAAASALSLSDSDEMAGVFQIDLNYPLNGGAGDAQARADAIRSWFRRGTRTGGVELGTVSALPAGPVDGSYRVVVSVAYRGFVSV